MELDEAFDGLVPAFNDIVNIIPDIGFIGRIASKGRGSTPEVTIEAVMYTVRTRGVASLREPETIERLKRCDDAARAQMDRHIGKLFPDRGAA